MTILFNGAVSSSGRSATKGIIIELGMICNEAAVAYLQYYPDILPGETEKNKKHLSHNKPSAV
jgi:hypothetical protein